MPKYMLGTKQHQPETFRCNTKPYMVDFIFPGEVKERYSFMYLSERSGRLIMQFYHLPYPGMIIEFKGHDWQVSRIREYAYERNSRDVKSISLVETEYRGLTQPDVIEEE